MGKEKVCVSSMYSCTTKRKVEAWCFRLSYMFSWDHKVTQLNQKVKLQKYLTPLWQLVKYGPSSENDFQNSDNEKMRPQKPATAFELQLLV